MSTSKHLVGILSLTAILVSFAQPGWSQCAMCKQALDSDADSNSTGTGDAAPMTGYTRGMFISILFLLGMLFTTCGGVVFLIMKEGRQTGDMMEFMKPPLIKQAIDGPPSE